MKIAIIIVSIIALVLAGFALYLLSANSKMRGEMMGKIDDLEEQVNILTVELEARVAEVSQEKEEEIDRLKGTYDALVADMKSEIELGQIKITQLADRLSVSMVDKILFPSGEAEITAEGLEILDRVGKVLKDAEGKVIRVEGHTDNVPIHPNLQKKFPTNWELSTARATNVVRFLQDEVGIKGTRLQVIGMSEYHPVASNANVAGRSQNRRIEITLLPESAGLAPTTK
ncbi:MAG: OmpA family protein [candidate division WOR-3 bacterium]|nr:MAG: OmpA family protein [candidate division WOR-3 bacterium]